MKTAYKTAAAILFLSTLLFVFSGCSSAPAVPSPGAAEPVKAESVPQQEAAPEDKTELTFDKNCEGPFYLTSVGQSADVSMLAKLLDNIGVEYSLEPTAKSADIEPAKTVFVAVGASTKGLGAAGISAEEELSRGEEVLEAARENGAVIIALHIGGNARRGELSDRFTDLAFSYADYIIMTQNGDEDGKYSKFAQEHSIPITFVAGISDAQEPLKAAIEN